jgi:peptidoglycan-associated lipoprotein
MPTRRSLTFATYFAAAALSACHHKAEPTPEPAPVATPAPVPDSSAIFAARKAHDDSVRAAAEEAARRAREDSLRAAQEAAARLEQMRQTLAEAIYFDFDKSDLRPASTATLDGKTPILQSSPGLKIRIEGNADERGSDEYNLALGMRRANSARRYLTTRGADSANIEVVSYGEERPVCTEHNETCWQQNRRDGFVIQSGAPEVASH